MPITSKQNDIALRKLLDGFQINYYGALFNLNSVRSDNSNIGTNESNSNVNANTTNIQVTLMANSLQNKCEILLPSRDLYYERKSFTG